MKRPHLKKPFYDSSVAWIACNGTPATVAALVGLVADQFGQSPADVAADVTQAMHKSDVLRGSPATRNMLAAIRIERTDPAKLERSDPARGV